MAGLQSEEGAAAMEHDGVKGETLVMLATSRDHHRTDPRDRRAQRQMFRYC